MTRRRKEPVADEHKQQPAQVSIGNLIATKQRAATSKINQKVLDAVMVDEQKLYVLWGKCGEGLGDYTRVRFELGGVVSRIMNVVRERKYPGGFRAFHIARNIPVPRQTCVRYASLFEDVASLHLKDEVLNAAFAAGIDLVKHVSKIQTAKTEVQKMDAPSFVAFLQQKPSRTQRPKLETVADFVDAGMAALAKVFDRIEEDEQKNQAYAGIAFQISIFSKQAAFAGGEFTVQSPLAPDELEELLREV